MVIVIAHGGRRIKSRLSNWGVSVLLRKSGAVLGGQG